MSEHDLIKKVKKTLTEPQYKLLKQLVYWSSSPKDYGLKKDGKTWIYNTYEQWAKQLNVSISTVRRTIKSLQDLGFISLDYLSTNKRNRTLYYSINFGVIEEFLNQKNKEINSPACVYISENLNQPNEQMVEHMNNTENKKQNINKSNKSQISFVYDNFETNTGSTENITKNENYSDTKEKSTIVQDMLRVWNQEFSNQKTISKLPGQTGTIHLTKHLAKFLVASFKLKFESCLEKWKRYLKLIKTSSFLMGEKFKLSIHWAIKFLTIDRIRAGELGVDESKIQIDQFEIEQKAIAHVNSVDESNSCKQFRYEVIEKLSPAVYLAWFTKVDMIEQANELIIKATNNFVKDYIKTNFLERFQNVSQVFCENLRRV